MAGGFRLRRFVRGQLPPTTMGLSVGARGRQPLVANAELKSLISGIPDGNTVTIAAPGTNDFLPTYAPLYLDGDALCGPGPLWNGTLETGFGGTIPSVPARTTARPSIRLVTPNRQAFDEDLTISVVSRAANGDVAYVECYADNPTPVTQTRKIRYYQDDNGVWQAIDGFHFTLDVSAYLTQVAAGGQINVFFKAYATDGTMQPSLLGAPTSTSNATRYQVVLNFYPRPVKNTWVKTVASSGTGQSGAVYDGVDYSGVAANYTTLEAALAARATASTSVKGGQIIFTQSGLYTPVNALNASVYNFIDGYLEIVAATGVTANIGRSSYDTGTNANGTANYVWRPACNSLMFRGQGVVLDYTYMQGVSLNGSDVNPGAPCAVMGARVTSTRNLAQLLWWDKKPLQTSGFAVSGVRKGITCVNDAVVDYGGFTFNLMAVNTIWNDVFADLFSVTDAVVGNIIDGYDPGVFRTHYNAFSVTYTGVAATATVQLAGGTFGTSQPTLTLTDSDHTAFTRVANGNIQDLVDWVNNTVAASSAGWSATMIATPDDGTTDRNTIYLVRVSSQSCKNVVRTYETWIDLHQDFYSFGTATRENKAIENNIGIGIAYVQEPFFDGQGTDITRVNNTFDMNPLNPQIPSEEVRGQWAANPKSHVYCAHNANPGMDMLLRNTGGTWSADSYTQIRNEVSERVEWLTSGSGSGNPVVTNSHLINGAGTNISTSGTIVTGSSTALMYPDRLSMDFTPGAPLLANLVAPSIAYDVIGNTRQATEAMGPWGQRRTAFTVTKEEFATMAIRTYAATGALGTLTATWKVGAGDTGAETGVIINVTAP